MSEGERGPRPAGSITIDQLLALNEEIAALVRAGVPLERGLVVAGRDLRGRLGRIATALSQRLSPGESLPEALEGEGRSIPPLYRAVVEAGARSGRLPIALEGLAKYVRGYAEARAAIGLALWYPLLVLTLAYALFVGLVSSASRGLSRRSICWAGRGRAVCAGCRGSARSVPYWWPVGPVLLFVLLIAWVRSGSAARFQAGSWSWLWLFPWMRSILANYETANFSELLGLLLEHRVPYPSAIVLAAESTGDARLCPGGPSTGRGDRAGRIRRGGAGRDRPRHVLAHDALGAGHGTGTGLAGGGPAQPRRCLPQASSVSGRQAVGVLAHDLDGRDRRERDLVLWARALHTADQPASGIGGAVNSR